MKNLRTDLLDNDLMTDLQWKFMMMDMTVLLCFLFKYWVNFGWILRLGGELAVGNVFHYILMYQLQCT